MGLEAAGSKGAIPTLRAAFTVHHLTCQAMGKLPRYIPFEVRMMPPCDIPKLSRFVNKKKRRDELGRPAKAR